MGPGIEKRAEFTSASFLIHESPEREEEREREKSLVLAKKKHLLFNISYSDGVVSPIRFLWIASQLASSTKKKVGC